MDGTAPYACLLRSPAQWIERYCRCRAPAALAPIFLPFILRTSVQPVAPAQGFDLCREG